MSLAANHSLQEAEVAFLEKLRAEYETKGYKFVVHPPGQICQSFSPLMSLTPWREDRTTTLRSR
jgi:hypothetical protein